jgi:GNAT superfamily N-acetyltransferase
MVETIIKYTPDLRLDLEKFRQQTFAEGNFSLDPRRFDPDTLQGQIWMAYVDDKLVSISAAEISHYSGETEVIRKCRYHILKDYRHGRYGFKFLTDMIPWCKENGYKLLYWTHDIDNRPLNALYQRQRTYAFSTDNEWFHKKPFTDLQFEKNMLFKTGDMLQFVYYIKIDDAFEWNPAPNKYIKYCNHQGDVDLIKTLDLT